ncbi:MAG: helix-turn-helix domain-containing protein [Clostridia bacterium]|nr:helix-turn-helix domain-containing protein [Clostridia bacterium]
MRAYDERYLDEAMRNLGEAADFAVNECNLSIDEFFDLFVGTKIAEQFGFGAPKYISGMTGVELVCEIFEKSGLGDVPHPSKKYDLSPEYWTGWILAFYQWFLGRSFKSILRHISPKEVLRLYPTLHEASEYKCADTFNKIIKNKNEQSRLKTMRLQAKLTQKELAAKAGVNLRTLQQYESKAKNINKASADAVLDLARALGCEAEDLLELDLEEAEF